MTTEPSTRAASNPTTATGPTVHSDSLATAIYSVMRFADVDAGTTKENRQLDCILFTFHGEYLTVAATEYGHHPETAAPRLRWALDTLHALYTQPRAGRPA